MAHSLSLSLSLQSSLTHTPQTSPFRSTETETETTKNTVKVYGKTKLTHDFFPSRTSVTVRVGERGRGRGAWRRRAIAAEEDKTQLIEDDIRRAIDKSEKLQEDPYGPVEAAMTSSVVTTTEDATLESILPLFEHYTGVPVADKNGKCVGIISNIDVAKYARGRADSLPTTTVKDVMTSPAYVILAHAPVAYAAALMLKHKVHRLPVVDTKGVIVGIVTRTDLFEPLIPQGNMMYHHLVGHQPEPRYDNL